MTFTLRLALLFLLLTCAVVAQTDAPVDTAMMADSAAMASPVPTFPPPAPVTGLTAADSPDDHGHSIMLSWQLSPDDKEGANGVKAYEVLRWIPSAMDSVHMLQRALDRATTALESSNSFLPRAGKIVARYESGGFADSAKLILDSIATMENARKLLPDSISALEERLEVLWERIPEAHRQYPNDGRWQIIGDPVPAGTSAFRDVSSREHADSTFLPNNVDYYYRVDAATPDFKVRTPSEVFGPIQAVGQWYNIGRTPTAVAVLVFAVFTIYFVFRAKRGADLYVRPLGGIEAVDEAIGRATEMGKPILYVLGLGTAADIATIASFTILGRVAKRVAEYQTELIVPCYDPIVMTVAQETVKSAYLDAGRPDDYKEDMVYFLTNSQFGYVGAVNGVMLRQLPATNVYMGKFYAESLILAETGALAGAIQISGTDEVAQIPFFVVACDYTLIGEELFAASAYLGREPLLLGSLKAQDYAKAAVIVLGLVMSILLNLQGDTGTWATTIKSFFKVTN